MNPPETMVTSEVRLNAIAARDSRVSFCTAGLCWGLIVSLEHTLHSFDHRLYPLDDLYLVTAQLEQVTDMFYKMKFVAEARTVG